jgi:hypothetical protein
MTDNTVNAASEIITVKPAANRIPRRFSMRFSEKDAALFGALNEASKAHGRPPVGWLVKTYLAKGLADYLPKTQEA